MASLEERIKRLTATVGQLQTAQSENLELARVDAIVLMHVANRFVDTVEDATRDWIAVAMQQGVKVDADHVAAFLDHVEAALDHAANIDANSDSTVAPTEATRETAQTSPV